MAADSSETDRDLASIRRRLGAPGHGADGMDQQLVEVQQGRGQVVALGNQHIPPELFHTCSYTFNYPHVLEELLEDHKDAVIIFILICLKSEVRLLDSVHGAEAKLNQPGGQNDSHHQILILLLTSRPLKPPHFLR